MNRIARVPVLAAAACSLLLLSAGCKTLEARDQLNKGVQAYKAAKFEEAINHFQKAVDLDPSYPMTRIFLATAYMQQVVPDLTSADNLKNADLAMNAYKKVLEEHPNDLTSMKGIATIYYDIDKFEEAKAWQKKVLAIDSQDAVAAYTIGSVDWRLAYGKTVATLKANNLDEDGKGNAKLAKPVCQALQKENQPLVDEGLQYLNQAVQIRQNYDDAMEYLQLMYRQKATLECGNDSARTADIAQADDWRSKAMGARKANEAKKEAKEGGGITLDQSK